MLAIAYMMLCNLLSVLFCWNFCVTSEIHNLPWAPHGITRFRYIQTKENGSRYYIYLFTTCIVFSLFLHTIFTMFKKCQSIYKLSTFSSICFLLSQGSCLFNLLFFLPLSLESLSNLISSLNVFAYIELYLEFP